MSADGRAPLRLAVYTDYAYRRDRDGTVYAERAFALFLAAMAEQVDRLVILGRLRPEPGSASYPLPSAVEFQPLPFYPAQTNLSRSLLGMARSLRAYAAVLRDVDVVWLFGPHPLALAFAGLAWVRGKRVALGVRQDLPEYVAGRHPGKRWIRLAAGMLELSYRLLARRTPTVVVGPRLEANYREAPQLLAMNVSLVAERDVIDPDRLPPRDYSGEIAVLSVGRIEREKNPLLLASILAELVERGVRARLVVCGEGPLADDLARELDARGVRARADLRGYVAFDGGLLDLYRDSHVFLHVSLTEGLPQVLFEAFAAGLPVVATAVGGVAAAAGESALLVPPDDCSAAADAVARVVADPELRERLVRAGHERVRGVTLESESGRVVQFLGLADG